MFELFATTAAAQLTYTVETGDDELRFASSAGSTKTKLSSQSVLSCVCGNLWRMMVFVLYIMEWTVALGRMKMKTKVNNFLVFVIYIIGSRCRDCELLRVYR